MPPPSTKISGPLYQKLNRAERRRLRATTDSIDKITDADRRFFERFPARRYRMRLSGQAEREQYQLLGDGGSEIGTGEALYTLVHSIVPGIRSRLFVVAGDDFDTDLPDSAVQRMWEAVRPPEFAQREDELRAAFAGKSNT
jgi:hypothetical protein